MVYLFFFSSRRRHTRFDCDWSSDVCSSDLYSHGRGVAKDEVEAINLFRKAGEAGEVGGFNNLAWILATSENSSIRNGPNAVFFGEKAVAATHRKKPRILDTLAAAYAEASQFEKAVKTEQEAIALVQ